jgi:hypothetical protein
MKQITKPDPKLTYIKIKLKKKSSNKKIQITKKI